MIKATKLTLSKIALSVPIIGAIVFYAWGPFSEYFLTGSYDENIMLVVETENIKLDDKNQILTIHVKPMNRGNVPVELNQKEHKSSLVVEIRKIESPETLKWLNPDNLPLLNKTDILGKYKDGYLIEPNAYYDEIEAMSVPNGFYWVKATLTFDDGEFIDQSTIARVSNGKN
jgi:hypothetical protein